MKATLVTYNSGAIVFQDESAKKYMGDFADRCKGLIVGKTYEVELIDVANPEQDPACDTCIQPYQYLKVIS